MYVLTYIRPDATTAQYGTNSDPLSSDHHYESLGTAAIKAFHVLRSEYGVPYTDAQRFGRALLRASQKQAGTQVRHGGTGLVARIDLVGTGTEKGS